MADSSRPSKVNAIELSGHASILTLAGRREFVFDAHRRREPENAIGHVKIIRTKLDIATSDYDR
jgi:hypothetical protein